MAHCIEPRESDWAHEWDGLVYSSPDGWIFSLSAWLNMIEEVPEWELVDESFGYWENGTLTAVMPLHFSPLTKQLSSSGWGGSGPVLVPGLDSQQRIRIQKKVLEEVSRRAERCEAKRFDFWIPPLTQTCLKNCRGVNPFVLVGMDDESGLSQALHIGGSESDLWGGLSKNARWAVRQAEKRGYSVERADWPENVDRYYDLHCETYRRTGVVPLPRKYFEGIGRDMAPRNHAALWGAYSSSGELVGFHNDAVFQKTVFYHTACSNQKALEDHVNYLLQWKALLGAQEAGAQWYDFGAIFPGTKDRKQQGLTTFKTRFGGQAHRFLKAGLEFENELEESTVEEESFSRPSVRLLSRIAGKLKGSLHGRSER